ncbi:MAG: YkvA family protein [Acidobacteriota bacterium]
MKTLTDDQVQALTGEVARVRPEDEEKVRTGFSQAETKAKQRGAARQLLENVKTLWRMLTDPDYVIDWQVKAWIIFALGYFISPIDVVPDVVPVLGYVDDAVVVAWVVHQLSDQVVAYRRWKGLA